MAIEKLISADSHVVEPPDLWEQYIEPKYRDRAPRMIRRDGADHWVVDEDVALGSVGAPSQAGQRFEDVGSLEVDGVFGETPPGAYDPHERLKEMRVDGVVGEVLQPTIGARLYTMPVESNLLSACLRALNDWMADFCRPYPHLLKGVGCINLDDIGVGMKELERCVDIGLSGAMISAFPGEDRPYDLPDYEPLWSLAEEARMPLVIHSGTQRPGVSRIGVFATGASLRGTANFYTNRDHWPRRSVGAMIFGGVFERHPGLKVGVVEYDIGWAPYFIRQMDIFYQEHGYVSEIRFKDGKVPGDFFRSNVYLTFMEDRVGIADRSVVGVENIMWGSDYPHRESTWPRSREILEETLEGVPRDDALKITYGNAQALFGFEAS